MDRLSLIADERKIVGKKVKSLRANGKLPGHVFGKGVESEAVTVASKEFLTAFTKVGETGLIDLKIGAEKIRPVLIRDVQYDPITGEPIHIDFYQVNLSEKVKVSVPVIQIGEPSEAVHLGEAIVLQTLNEVEVEALPTDLPERIEVDVSLLKAIDDAITVGQLLVDREKITLHAEPEEIVIKLAPAVSAETEKLLEEQAAEQAAQAAEAQVEEGAAAEGEPKEGAAPAEGEVAEGAEAVPGETSAESGEAGPPEGGEAAKEEKPQE